MNRGDFRVCFIENGKKIKARRVESGITLTLTGINRGIESNGSDKSNAIPINIDTLFL